MNRKVLIVDDNEALAESLAEILTRRGYEAESVGDIHAARTRLDRVRIDLLVLDVDLCGESGPQFLRKLRQQGVCVPVVLITARASDHVRDELRLDQPVDVVEKPISIDSLVELMDQLLGVHTSRASVVQTSILLLSFNSEVRLPLASPEERLRLGPVPSRESLPPRQSRSHGWS